MRLSAQTVTMDHAALLWRWANDPETRQNSLNTSPIGYAEHVAWLEARVQSATTRFWIFRDGDRAVGQVRCEISDDTAEIHIAVAPGERGRGYSRRILEAALGQLRNEARRPVRARAAVLAHNARSLRLFKACGFHELAAVDHADGRRAILFELRVPPGAVDSHP